MRSLLSILLIAVHSASAYLFEPMLTGRASGLSPLVVLVALVFWGHAWGVIGVVLAVPLTSIIKIAMENVSRAFEKGETEGFMKILVDADTKEILGASFLGTSGDEVIHCVLDVMYAKAPSTVLERAMHIHPTVAEFIPSILQDLTPLPPAAGA